MISKSSGLLSLAKITSSLIFPVVSAIGELRELSLAGWDSALFAAGLFLDGIYLPPYHGWM